ncbi:MAG: hypothetical protein VX908_01855 [Planctomycetota bacterium]|nr:hypothetical protein [Planctomycetota bacterium]
MQDEMTMSAPGMEMPSKPSSWPTVLGILGIILASIGLLSGFCGLLGGLFMSSLMDLIASSMPEDQRAEMVASMPTSGFMLVEGIAGLALGLMLLVGSIRLVKRRDTCRGLLNTWAMVSIIYLIASTTYQITVVMPQMHEKVEAAEQAMIEAQQQAESSTDEATSTEHSSMETYEQQKMAQQWSSTFGLGCGIVFNLAWIIIILVFMNGGKYRSEIESWGEA